MESERFDLKEFKEVQKRNLAERLKFIDMWVEWMKKHPKTWSKEQKRLIEWVMFS